MPAIADVLKEKYGVSGNNIAEILSNHTGKRTSNIADALKDTASGGSGDFSIAMLTVENGSSLVIPLPTLWIDPSNDREGTIPVSLGIGSSPFPIVLYKGKAYLPFTEGSIKSVSGAIAYDQSTGTWIMTGDCTVTLETEVL